ncbi:YebC/PmpR family DNA-binding transcriptional regulator [Humisphaera borealis]|uniref:Probable transcriptional regulatory protein IPV69_22355 n=1 Tax=Humisphaera borealis TaxID=2807512 RepID=A0A7M2WU11_9BACT|nr:YebC/PmpR family DNA-binding transcriptional regulator [Humisphaera borealis]QOV88939.1 YebC/PmpR family DNA-binding transcriptional regulator [Humisphaera borealis]
MAGHSHWAKIKRAKGANDKKRAKVWSKIARKIIIAAKAGGGDPADNLSLRYVIEEAKGVNMTKDTITNAIKKGTGELGAENYEDAVYEGYCSGVAIIVEALTNNRARTVADLRFMFEKHGGSFAATGSVLFQFTKQGVITIKSEGVDEDTLMELALESGAEDVRNEGEVFEVVTTPTAFHKVRNTLGEKYTLEGSEIAYVANSTAQVDVEVGHKLLKLVDALEDNDDVQNVSHNAEIPEAAMA